MSLSAPVYIWDMDWHKLRYNALQTAWSIETACYLYQRANGAFNLAKEKNLSYDVYKRLKKYCLWDMKATKTSLNIHRTNDWT